MNQDCAVTVPSASKDCTGSGTVAHIRYILWQGAGENQRAALVRGPLAVTPGLAISAGTS